MKRDKSQGSWVFRYTMHERPRSMGLGGMRDVPLAKARELRDRFAEMVTEGVDPQVDRKKRKREAVQALKSFQEVAEDAFESRKAELRGDGKAGRWFSPLKLHVLPKLGAQPIVQIDQNDLRETLSPIWHEKADTARKALNRINIVFKHAAALGLDVDMYAPAKAKELLGASRHVRKNIPSMPYEEISEFYRSLRDDSPAHLALRFLILNPGPRSKPVRFMHIDQLNKDVWTVPADFMKGIRNKTKEWRTPLSRQSMELLELAGKFEANGYLFPNATGKGVISDASMSRIMQRRGLEYRPHGFRASFRTWAAEMRKSRDIAELCLAHKIYDAVELAYLRTDQLKERKTLMQEWSDYIAP